MKLKFPIFLLGLFLPLASLYAQTNAEGEASLLLHETDGIHIESKDSLYSINLRFRLQNRYEYTSEDDNPFNGKSSNFLVRRLRLRSFGYLGRKNITYQFQIGFSRYDQDWDNTKEVNIIRDAVVAYRFNKSFEVAFGQTKLPGNRQRVISSGEQQFVDRSLVNATFNVDRDAGIFGYYRNSNHSVNFNILGSITSGSGRNVPNKDKGLAYTGKVEVLPFGQFTLRGDYFEGDWARETTPKLSVAAAYSYNDEATREGGTIGENLNYTSDIRTLFLDFIFKYQGFAMYGELVDRDADIPMTTFDDGTVTYIYDGQGLNLQSSYQTPKHLEFGARFSRLMPSAGIESQTSAMSQFTIMASRYIKWHRIKVQTDLTYQDVDHPTTTLGDQWQYRFQLEVGI
jgi:phosphate-selective porin OprO and OprP